MIDVVEALTGTDRPRKYWNDLKKKLIREGYIEVSEKIGQLKLTAPDGKLRDTDCGNTETIFRIIQTIPSPKAEPFKRWLAKVGYERIQEIEDPELATKRTRMLYKLKGYPEDWIENKKLKGLKRENLRDHMDDFELILTMLGERTTTEIHRTKDTRGVPRLKDDARVGGQIACTARKQIERKLGRAIVSKNNFLQNRKAIKK